MYKCTQFLPFMQTLFDDPEIARKASRIAAGIMQGRSPRLSDIAREMSGNEAANYKMIQRFLDGIEPQTALLRLFQEEAPFVIGDPTEMPRPQAKKTEYVGTLSDGETKGYWLMILATPYHGRAIPCGFVDYSSRTINQDATSRNQHHFAAFRQIKELLGERPLVLDREFSYLELLENLALEEVNFVIRLKVGPLFCDGEGKPVTLSIQKGETRILNKVFYKGKVFVNVIGVWQKGFSDPMWIMTNLDAKTGLAIYYERMKIEETFRDLKSLLNFHKLMNKRRTQMEKMVALILIAYAIVLVVGETLRAQLFPEGCRKNTLFSGPFIFLKLKPDLAPPVLSQARLAFSQLVFPVRTYV
jgi:Transposase DDE domain